MAEPLILYSTNTWLAYEISERYFGGMHYAWCAPVFDSDSRYSREVVLTATSNPVKIYRNLRDETRGGDRHSAKVQENKVGILRGATLNRAAGIITPAQERDIVAIVEKAETADFRPLLYIIPFSSVSSMVAEVPVERRAHPLAREYLIERLPRECFDVIEFPV
jgi:hypothetical protein